MGSRGWGFGRVCIVLWVCLWVFFFGERVFRGGLRFEKVEESCCVVVEKIREEGGREERV